ncbi:MAG: hypothetical protein ABIU97_07885 [Dehalococcoidia bacterium]
MFISATVRAGEADDVRAILGYDHVLVGRWYGQALFPNVQSVLEDRACEKFRAESVTIGIAPAIGMNCCNGLRIISGCLAIAHWGRSDFR